MLKSPLFICNILGVLIRKSREKGEASESNKCSELLGMLKVDCRCCVPALGPPSRATPDYQSLGQGMTCFNRQD